jgi:hypothetical protein
MNRKPVIKNLFTTNPILPITIGVLFFYAAVCGGRNIFLSNLHWFFLTEYILSTILLNVINIYEDSFEVIYPTRIWLRRRIIPFSDVEKVKYDDVRGGRRIGFVLYKNRRKGTFFFELGTNVHRYKNRKMILKFLQSKGLQIVINSEWEKERMILED